MFKRERDSETAPERKQEMMMMTNKCMRLQIKAKPNAHSTV